MPPGIYQHHKQDEVERFWRYVDKKDDKECWNWTASTTKGYGSFKTSQGQYSHRFSYALFHPYTFDITDASVHIRHSCDNPLCVSPYHLAAGTFAENMNDMKVRGRGKGYNTGKSGEATNNSKLTNEQVKQIKERLQNYKRGDAGKIAKEFNISRKNISSIKLGKIWKEI